MDTSFILHVFYVDIGRELQFKFPVAFETVKKLKKEIEQEYHVPPQKQILLISGGITLNDDTAVCSCSQGTDTSPIFLFTRLYSETGIIPQVYIEPVYDVDDLYLQVKEAMELPPTFATVESRSKLAKTFQEIADSHLKWSNTMLREQHMQQQGWAAVMAHLDDLSSTFKHRWSVYKELFHEYIAQRNYYLECLNAFKDDVLLLQKIPLLPALIESQKLLVPDKNSQSLFDNASSLFDWIVQQDNFMDHMFDICTRGLCHNDEATFRALEMDVEKLLRDCENIQMKEIKGFGDRLCTLNELMEKMKGYVQEQSDLAQSFERNHTRAAQIREPSVLPDLCATHVQQLTVLQTNQNGIRDKATRFRKSKKDLCDHLNLRLGWVIWIEDRITEFDNTIVRKFQQLRTLEENLEILQQIHATPMRYVLTVAEVIRRRRFSQSFLMWTSDIACNLLTIYSEELSKRKEFQASIDSHFISALFTGMDDLPPAFATQAPSIFDSNLPKLTEQDLETLKNILPDLEEHLNVGEVNIALNFFLPKDSPDRSNDNKAVEDKLIEVVAEAGLASNLDQNLLKAIEPAQATPPGLPHLKDIDRGCESETDTEEFEKVGQSPFELNFDKATTSPRPGTQDASTLTEDNLQISRSEHERVKSVLVQFAQTCALAHSQLKAELLDLKERLLAQKTLLSESVNDITSNLDSAVLQRERECIQRITVDHELEISDFRKIAQGKNEEIKSLRDSVSCLKAELKTEAERNKDIETRFNNLAKDAVKDAEQVKKCCEEIEAEKVKQIREVTEELNRKHKAEIENMRCRFKLMTMERSPSENSLEKIERGGESSSTEAILLQMRENFESAKEVAVSEAVSQENQKWEKLLAEDIKELEAKFAEEKMELREEVERRISREKDKQIETLREQMRNLSLECVKHKSTIQQLTEQKDDCRNDLLKTIGDLELKILEMEKSRSAQISEMGASVAVFEGEVLDASTSDVATSPIKMKRVEKKPELSAKIGKLSTDSCKPGEIVLVIWDSNYKNFKIVQESSYLFFLNADSFEPLGIKILEDGTPNKSYCFAEVIEKEYCHARKDEQFVVFQPTNRYRVPQGTKFFRVKAKATGYNKELPMLAPGSQRPAQMTQSQTTSSVDVLFGEEPSKSLPPSPTKAASESANCSPQPSPIPEEKGEDSINSESTEEAERASEDIEKATELTENFNVEDEPSEPKRILGGDQVSIDRSQICIVA